MGYTKEHLKAVKKYIKSKGGYLRIKYIGMKNRVGNHPRYLGLPLLDKQIFYRWSEKNDDYNRLFDQWVASGYQRKLSPSINRINSNLGYTVDNIEWITHSENSRLGGLKMVKTNCYQCGNATFGKTTKKLCKDCRRYRQIERSKRWAKINRAEHNRRTLACYHRNKHKKKFY